MMSEAEVTLETPVDESNTESAETVENGDQLGEDDTVPQEENEAEPMEGDLIEAANDDQADYQEDAEDVDCLNELEDFDVEGSPDDLAHRLPSEMLEDSIDDSNTAENNDATQASDNTEDSQTNISASVVQSTSVNSSSSTEQSNVKGIPSPSSSETKTVDSSADAEKKEVKDESSRMYESGDDSFVVQVDDTMLREIDADLLDSTHADTKSSETEPSSTAGATAPSNKQDGTAPPNVKPDPDASTENLTKAAAQSTDAKDLKQATTSKDDKETKTAPKSTPVKTVKKDEKAAQSSRNLWVSGLSSSTRATDLKTLFSKHGKVVGAKVVTNARSPGSRCYGFVTMGTADDATKSIQHLHRTELHGRMISVERAKTEPQGTKAVAKVLPPSSLKSPPKPGVNRAGSSKRPVPPRREDDKEHAHSEKEDAKLKEKEKLDVLSFEKIKAERERERLRRKEMYLRHEERRRQMDVEREQYKQRMIEKRQREEAMKIERERKRLREMRDDLERERMETERLRLETERMEMERQQENYRREQQRVLQDRRPVKRQADRDSSRDEEWHGSKRMPTERYQSDRGHFERKERFDRREGPERQGRYERQERGGGGGGGGGGRHERYTERERPPRERETRDREFTRRDEHRPSYREDRGRDGRSSRDERSGRDGRNPSRQDSRTDWKSDRESSRGSGGGSGAWNGPVDHKLDGSWGQSGSSMSQGDGWENGAVMSQPGSGTFSIQQGPMMTGSMGGGHVFIAQPAMQGTPVMMEASMPRQSDGRYGMTTSVRRF